MSQEITYYDCKKGAEVTLYLDENGAVTECDLYFPDPLQELQTFFTTDLVLRAPPSTSMPASRVKSDFPSPSLNMDRGGVQ